MLNPRDVRRLEIRAFLIGAPVMLFSWLIGRITDALDGLFLWTWTIGILLVGGSIGHAIYKHTRLAQRRRCYHAPGWATRYDFANVFGRCALLRLAEFIRPSLVVKGLTWERFKRRKATDYGRDLGKAVTGSLLVRRKRVYASFERCILVIAPPGAGKTSLTLHSVLDAPGGLLTASTKPDVYLHTAELRAKLGPVRLFNPQNIGDLPSDFEWDPLTDCQHYQHATDRATALVRGTRGIAGMDDKIWAEKCIQILSKYLMAAKLAEFSMFDVARWVDNPDDEQAVRILRHFDHVVPAGWAGALEAEIRSKADRMKGSMWSLLRGAVGFMANPQIARVCRGGAGAGFNAAEFARSRGTLYLLGDDNDEVIAPLLNALTAYIYAAVKAKATMGSAERLDPPFGFSLDEAAKITPVPLAGWAADARGHGIYIDAVVQSLAQLRERWGAEGADAIKGLFANIILGGIPAVDDLEDFSTLIGTRPGETTMADFMDTSLTDHHGLGPRREPIMRPEEIRKIRRGHALVIIGEANAVITTYKKGQIRATKERKKLHKRLAKDGRMPSITLRPPPIDVGVVDPLTNEPPVTRERAGVA